MEPILYKKKVTTTVKEYYKLPEDPVTVVSTETSYTPPGQAPMFDRETFSSSIKSYFDSYGRKMKDMLGAVDGTQEQLDAAEENMFADIWAISTLLRPFYSAEFSEKVLQSVRSIALINLQVVDSIRRGVDSKIWEERLVPWPVNDLAVNLSLYNSLMDREQVRFLWSTVTSSWISALKGKVNKDDAQFNQSISQADEALGEFSSLISRAIINRHPQMFAPLTV